MTDSDRKRRDPPGRKSPIRNAATSPPPAEPIAADAVRSNQAAQGLDGAVTDAVANAVQLGYQVLAQNIEEGRIAAKQFRVGEYNVRNVPHDLNQLSVRLLHLTRELSTTTFDLLERLLNDPANPGALQRSANATSGGQTPPANPAGPSTATAPPPTAAPSPAAPVSTPNSVALTCRFTPPGKAVVKAAALTRPETPTPLTMIGLSSVDPSLPAIGDVKFSAAEDGYGVVANIALEDDQPAGLYSGIVLAADTQLPLGTLTIQVLP
jgi:hypothetical protein